MKKQSQLISKVKTIIAVISTFVVVGLMFFTFNNGRAYHGGEAGNIIEDIKPKVANQTTVEPIKEKEDIEGDKLKALRDKAGNTASFEVSNAYRSKCSSCHGVNGSGLQNGRKLMGSSIIGQTEEELYTSLIDFKSGRRENLIMKGLLMNLSEEDLRNFAKEISQFKTKKEASK